MIFTVQVRLYEKKLDVTAINNLIYMLFVSNFNQ